MTKGMVFTITELAQDAVHYVIEDLKTDYKVTGSISNSDTDALTQNIIYAYKQFVARAVAIRNILEDCIDTTETGLVIDVESLDKRLNGESNV